MRRPWPLVGRTNELALVCAQLAGEEGGGVVVAGQAGAGKTRLASECLTLAEQRGLAVARVKATEAARDLPFGALAPLLPRTFGTRIDPGVMLWRAREAIVALGEGRRLVLLVDDAHLLDDASATLVHQLVATQAVFVIATVRTGEPAPDAIVALWKDELAERLDLAPLSPASIEEVLTRVLGGPVNAGTLHQLTERSAGNALYLRELVRAGEAAGQLREESGVWRLDGSPVMSGRLVELIEGRLAKVVDPERIVLDALAHGEPLGVACLLGITTSAKLEELEQQGLIVTARNGRRLDVCLTHPLYGEVLRSKIPALRAQTVRKSLADRVESLGARRPGDLLRLAAWRVDGGGAMAPDLMVAAASLACDRWDLALARRLAEAAEVAGGGFEATMVRAEVAVLEGRGEEAEELLAGLLLRADDDAQRVRVASARVDNLTSRLGRTDEALRVTEEATRLVTDPAALDQLTAKRAFTLHVSGRLQDALDLLEPLLARADGPSFGLAWYVGASCMVRAGRFAEALSLCEKLAKAAASGDSRSVRPSLDAMVRSAVLAGAGRLSEGQQVALHEYRNGVRDGSRTVQAVFALHVARVEVAMGTVTSAARYAAEARDLFLEKQWSNLARTALTELALAHALAGSADRAQSALAEIDALHLPPDDLNAVELGRARGWTLASAGDLVGAQRELRRAAALAHTRGDLVWEAEALHDLARLGLPEEALPRLRELATLVEGDLAPARARYAAAVAGADAGALADVSVAFEGMGAYLLAAEAAAGAAVFLRRAGHARRAVAAEVRAADLARRCQGASTPPLRDIQTQALLSSREIEVAALGAAGLSNRDIADRLCVSVRTVENHLQHVYEKLGVARRADLAQALSSVEH